MQHMRLISEAYREICKNDPDTAITKHGFRRLVNAGKIPSVQVGRKRLVAMEAVNRFFYEGSYKENELYEKGKIHPIEE